MSESTTETDATPETPRRGFLGLASTAIMGTGLAAGYGTLAAFAGRFLYPAAKKTERWQFVATIEQMAVGQAIPFQLPSGSKVVVARQEGGDSVDSFIALSSICPHLGCAVHWEPQHERFFCPCHNGAFDPTGRATEGPPATANQSLKKFPLKVEKGLLYIAVSADSLVMNQPEASAPRSRRERAQA